MPSKYDQLRCIASRVEFALSARSNCPPLTDLAIGARQTWSMMDSQTKNGESKLVVQRTDPLTDIACVKRISTERATLECTPQGLRIIGKVGGLTLAGLEKLVGLPIAA